MSHYLVSRFQGICQAKIHSHAISFPFQFKAYACLTSKFFYWCHIRSHFQKGVAMARDILPLAFASNKTPGYEFEWG